MPNRSIEVLNESDDFQRRLDWVLFTNDNENHQSESDWVPGVPLWENPRYASSAQYWDEDLEEYLGGGQVVRPMFEVFDESFGLVSESFIPRCEDCDVYWTGDDPCFVCGTDAPSDWAKPIERQSFGELYRAMFPRTVVDADTIRLAYGGTRGPRVQHFVFDEAQRVDATHFSIGFRAQSEQFTAVMRSTGEAIQRMWAALNAPFMDLETWQVDWLNPGEVKPYRPRNVRSPFQKLELRDGKLRLTSLDDMRDYWDKPVSPGLVRINRHWLTQVRRIELPEFDIADHYSDVSWPWECLSPRPRKEPERWSNPSIGQQRRRRNV